MRVLSIIPTLLLLLGCPACQVGSSHAPRDADRVPTAQEQANWLATNHLLPASADEIRMARSTEVRFVGHQADSPDKRVRVVFHMGTFEKHGADGVAGQNFTTTSYYQLIDARAGKPLARVESKLSKQWDRAREDQKVWFSPDGHTALIFESLTDGNECVGMYALLCFQPEGSSWTLRYLAPPKAGGLPNRDTDPIPAGLLGDMMVLDAWATGQFHKMKISDIPTSRSPLPFTVG